MTQLTVPPTSEPNLNQEITKERLRQARQSFTLALVATAMSTLIGLVGAGLLLTEKANEGAVTAVSGMVASARCVQLAKDANDRLDKIGQARR